MQLNGQSNGFNIAFNVAFGISFLAASFVLFLVKGMHQRGMTCTTKPA